jgi:hypothetical protein
MAPISRAASSGGVNVALISQQIGVQGCCSSVVLEAREKGLSPQWRMLESDEERLPGTGFK